MLHTSLKLVIAGQPCGRVEDLKAHLAGKGTGADTLFPLTDLLEVPGLCVPEDALWALQCVPQAEKAACERIARLFSCDCAERALLRERAAGREPDARSFAAIEVARRFAKGEATDEERRNAAAAAAAADAAAAAADAAAWRKARDEERQWQAQHLRDLLAQDEVPA